MYNIHIGNSWLFLQSFELQGWCHWFHWIPSLIRVPRIDAHARVETGGQLHNKWNNLDVFSMSVRWQPPIGGCWMQLQVHMTNALQNGTIRWHICTCGWSDQRLIQWICNVYFRSMNPIRYIKINPINMQCPSTADLFSMDPIRIVPILSEGAQKGSNTDW